jgi:hypothetical protein
LLYLAIGNDECAFWVWNYNVFFSFFYDAWDLRNRKNRNTFCLRKLAQKEKMHYHGLQTTFASNEKPKHKHGNYSNNKVYKPFFDFFMWFLRFVTINITSLKGGDYHFSPCLLYSDLGY